MIEIHAQFNEISWPESLNRQNYIAPKSHEVLGVSLSSELPQKFSDFVKRNFTNFSKCDLETISTILGILFVVFFETNIKSYET